jgi:hypothetical protein
LTVRATRSQPSRLLARLGAVLLAAAIASLAVSVETPSAQRAERSPGADAGRPEAAGGTRQPDRGRGAGGDRPALPAAPALDGEERNERLGRDPFAAMGGGSPLCKRGGLAARERSNCRGSGALSHPHRIDHYGFDTHIDTGIDNIGGNVAAAIQSLLAAAWLGLLYAVKGVTLLLEWAFSLDLLSEAMQATKRALLRLHQSVFGQAWFLAAISAAGLWAIYRGFVQHKTIQTFTGLAATVALMLVALVIINNPVGTVGRANQLANDAALGIVAGATTGSVDDSPKGFGEAMTRIFDHAVLRPWCALEFSDVEFCLSRPTKVIDRDAVPGNRSIEAAWAQSRSVADMFLRFEPNGEDDVDQRKEIYEDWKDNDGTRLQAVTRIQKEPSTGPRFALFALITVGLLGMICVLAWVGLRLLGYGVMSLVLILFAPVALLLPALGDSGRQTFIAWAKRLLGTLVAKAVYAVFLALVLVASAALAALDSLGWVAVWLLQCVFWWTLFAKRNDLIQFVSAPGLGPGEQRQSGSMLQRLYYGTHAARTAKGLAGAAKRRGLVTTLPARRRAATATQATQATVEGQARERARTELERRHEDAGALVGRDEQLRQHLNRVDRQLRKYDDRTELAKANGAEAPTPTDAEAALIARREALRAERPPPAAVAAAREQVRHAEVNRARTGSAISAADERAHIERRRRELATLPADHEHNLRAAGVDPALYRALPAAEREQLHAHVGARLERERVQLAAIPDPTAGGGRDANGELAGAVPTRRALRDARHTLDPDQLRAARKQEIEHRRAHRRAERQRARLRPRARQ